MESMHQNPDVFAEPLKYYPERFMNNLKTMDAAAKGRMCPGIYIAEVELFTSFIQVLSKCKTGPYLNPSMMTAF
ncbi:hypothetical protein INT47_012461 [Mucor saturninus]|uniref:Cytochrome P450 n=1 Tax=Mucor saturninus TaxID=64648 RepID=A0A8H7QIA4_9FUNG|nr:hypothetical protein INT47_012461 [Mucor saturninus]